MSIQTKSHQQGVLQGLLVSLTNATVLLPITVSLLFIIIHYQFGMAGFGLLVLAFYCIIILLSMTFMLTLKLRE